MPEESPNEPSSYPKSVRITPDKQKLLDELGLSLKEASDIGIQVKVKEKEKLSKMQKKGKAVIDGIYLMIGIGFIWTLNFSNNIYAVAIIGGIGAGFIIIGGSGLYKGMKSEGVFERLRPK